MLPPWSWNHFGIPDAKNLPLEKTLMRWIEGRRRKMMRWWHHTIGHEFEALKMLRMPGCCSPWAAARHDEWLENDWFIPQKRKPVHCRYLQFTFRIYGTHNAKIFSRQVAKSSTDNVLSLVDHSSPCMTLWMRTRVPQKTEKVISDRV